MQLDTGVNHSTSPQEKKKKKERDLHLVLKFNGFIVNLMIGKATAWEDDFCLGAAPCDCVLHALFWQSIQLSCLPFIHSLQETAVNDLS